MFLILFNIYIYMFSIIYICFLLLTMFRYSIATDQVQPLKSFDNSFKLIDAVKRNNIVSAKNFINANTYNLIDNVDDNGWTALHWACYYGYEKMVALLIENKPDIDIKTKEGLGDDPEYANKTAKDIAELRHHKKCANIILKYSIKRRFSKSLRIAKSFTNLIP